MARLLLFLDNQPLGEYNLNKERYTIGRLPDNDIRLDSTAVSGHHALVINILNDSFLEDLNSTNGTYVNGKLIKKHALQHGDVITCGHHQLRFVDDLVSHAPAADFTRTQVIQPGSVPDARAPLTGSRQATPAKARLHVLSGAAAGRELELVKTLTTIGTPGTQVAAITRRADGFYLLHIESAQPGEFPLVNGQSIGIDGQLLQDGDVITLAGVRMAFVAN
jgi:hypothetical protein